MSEQLQSVVVDDAVCEGNAVCVRIEKTVFELHPVEDLVQIISQPQTAEVMRRVEMAVRRCPKQALKLVPREDQPGILNGEIQ